MNKRKTYIFVSMTIFLSIIILEVFSAAFLFISMKQFDSPKGLSEQAFSEFEYSKDRKDVCGTYEDFLEANPYMGYVLNSSGPCKEDDPNGFDGYNGREHLNESDKNYFDILILGGSVAEQLSVIKDKGGEYYLEVLLNKKFKYKKFKGFRIYNMALGDYSQPMQINALVQSRTWIDGFVDFSGYNESHFLLKFHTSNKKFRTMPNFKNIVNSNNKKYVTGFFSRVISLYETKHNSLSNYSYLVLMIKKQFFELTKYFAVKVINNDFEFNSGYWHYPKEYSDEKNYKLRMKQAKSYYNSMEMLAKGTGIDSLYIIQPVLYTKKNKTEKEKLMEKKYFDNNEVEYSNDYGNMTLEFMSLRNNGLNIHDFRGVFDDAKSTSFIDDVHVDVHDISSGSGANILCNKVASLIAKQWGFENK